MNKYLYEFIGTFFLVLTVGMTVMPPHEAGLLAPLAIGSVLAVMVYAGGYISGGHYNPAVSLAVYHAGALSSQELVKYWAAQFLGAVFASLIVWLFKGFAEQTVALAIVPAWIAEFLFTFALCFVVLNVAVSDKNKGNSYFGFAIGFTVLAGAYAVGPISGGAFNPAVALGITLLQLISWKYIWVYFVACLPAAAVASYVFTCGKQK